MVASVVAVRPDLVYGAQPALRARTLEIRRAGATTGAEARMSTSTRSNRRFFAVFLLVALLIAGVASYYASSHPDGLNFVAEKTGFIDKEKESPTADGPFAGYSTKGIDDDRLSGGVAGVAGCLLVLASAAACSGCCAAATATTPPTPSRSTPRPRAPERWAPVTATGCTTTATASSTGLRRTSSWSRWSSFMLVVVATPREWYAGLRRSTC